MPLYKNVASQKISIYVTDENNDPVTGDAANITAKISLDGAAAASTNDTNPTEIDAGDCPGIYQFDLTQAETNADLIIISPDSSTADVFIEPIEARTIPGDNAALNVSLTEIKGSALSGTAAQLAAAFNQFFDVSTPRGDMKDVAYARSAVAAVRDGVGTATVNTYDRDGTTLLCTHTIDGSGNITATTYF